MISFRQFITEKISPTFITHLEKMRPIDFLSLIKELDSKYKGILDLSDISITEKIDGSSLTIGQNERGESFMNTKMSQRYFNVGDFTKYAISKGYQTDLSKKFDHILSMIKTDKKLQKVLSKHNTGNGIVIVGEILYVPLATEIDSGKLQFIFMDYDRKNLGTEWTFIPFNVQDFDGNPIDNKEDIFRDLYKISTSERKYTDAKLNVDANIDVTLSINKVKKNILSKYNNIGDILKSRKKIDKPLKDKIKSEIEAYQEQLAAQILSYVKSGKFGNDFEGIVLKTKSGINIKATSPHFKKRKSELTKKKFGK
jgi:hypothetical protein